MTGSTGDVVVVKSVKNLTSCLILCHRCNCGV